MKAIFRWNINCIDNLPDYMKILYTTTLELYEEIEQEMRNEGRVYALNYYVKEV